MLTSDVLYAHILACAFFNKAFLMEPVEETFARICRDELFEEWPIETATDSSRKGLGILQTFFRGYSEERFEDIRQDHARLFVGPADIVPVWESVWTTKDRLLFDTPTLEVRAFYEKYGLAVEQQGMEPDDHIGYEFAFMGHLLASALHAEENGDSAGERELVAAAGLFLASHLGTWAHDCLGKMAERAESDFYRGAALLGLGYLEELALLLQEPEE